MRVFKRDEGGLVFALAADKLPANKAKEVYAVWFTKKGVEPRNLGFSQSQVGKEGVFTTGGPQQGQEAQFAKWLVDYDTIVVARASADSASAEEARPGRALRHAARRPGLAPSRTLRRRAAPAREPRRPARRRVPAAARRRRDLVVRRPDGHGRARLRGARDRRLGVRDRHRARRAHGRAAGEPAARRRRRRPRVAAGDHGLRGRRRGCVTQGVLAALRHRGRGRGVERRAAVGPDRRSRPGSSTRPRPACCPRSSPPERLQQANGVRATAMSAGEIGGPVLAGVLVAAVGAGWALAVDAATFARQRAAAGRRARAAARASARPPRFWADLREGWTMFRGTTWVWTFVLWASLANVTWGAWSVLGPVSPSASSAAPPRGARSTRRSASAR